MKKEFIKNCIRFTITSLSKLDELDENGFAYEPNPKVRKEQADCVLVDLYEKKYTYISKIIQGKLFDLIDLNDCYTEELLSTIVTVL